MSEKPSTIGDEEVLALAGMLATGVSGELARPLRELRETLAELVDSLDQHIGNADGPTPLPWRSVGRVRDTLANAYLQSRTIARLAGDLASAVAPAASVAAPSDLNVVVEAALNLARHRVSQSTEVFMDYGSLPAVRTVAAWIMLALARALAASGEATRQVADGAISIRTRRVSDAEVVVAVADNGRRQQSSAERTTAVVASLVEPAGATVSSSWDEQAGYTLELHFSL